MTEAEVQRLMGLHDVAADDSADLARSIGTADQDYWARKKIASRAALESALRELLPASPSATTAPAAPKEFQAEREQVQRAITRAQKWLMGVGSSQPPRPEIALLWTLAQATLDMQPAAPAAPEVPNSPGFPDGSRVPADARDARRHLTDEDCERLKPKNREEAIAFLKRVGILTEDGGLSPNYYSAEEIEAHTRRAAMAAPTPQEQKP